KDGIIYFKDSLSNFDWDFIYLFIKINSNTKNPILLPGDLLGRLVISKEKNNTSQIHLVRLIHIKKPLDNFNALSEEYFRCINKNQKLILDHQNIKFEWEPFDNAYYDYNI